MQQGPEVKREEVGRKRRKGIPWGHLIEILFSSAAFYSGLVLFLKTAHPNWKLKFMEPAYSVFCGEVKGPF